MTLNPVFKSPFTDLISTVLTHQSGNDKCGDFELRLMDCFEAYGLVRGEEKCAKLITDFNECVQMDKQLKRFHAMRNERERQFKEGQLTKENHYAPAPKFDSY